MKAMMTYILTFLAVIGISATVAITFNHIWEWVNNND